MDHTCDYMLKNNTEKENLRKRVLDDDTIDFNNISKEMMFDYSIDPYGGD